MYYYVKKWDRGTVVKKTKSLPYAEKWAKAQGHDGKDYPGGNEYCPLAFVQDETGLIVYIPRFGKNISQAASGLINAQPSNHF